MIRRIKNLFSVRMPRTVESTVFEIVSAVLLVVMWLVATIVMRGSGKDAHWQMLMLAVGATVVVGFSLFSAYYPKMVMVNSNFFPKKATAMQCRCLCRMVRVLAVELVPTATFGIMSEAGYRWADAASLCCVLFLIATSLYCSLKARCDSFSVADIIDLFRI